MSQAALAGEMSARGWPWYQQTVYKLETGRQAGVSLGEATDLAEILGISVDRLTWAGEETAETGLVDLAASDVTAAFNEASDAVAGLLAARARAESTLKSAQGSTYQRVRDAAADLENVLAEADPGRVVAEGEARYAGEEDA